MIKNLNEVRIPTGKSYDEPLLDYGTTSGNVEVVFRDIEERLIQEINGADFVVGCVAWLTNRRILQALGDVECCIIVQKEDFLRPDIDGNKTELQRLYNLLSNKRARFEFWAPLSEMSSGGDTGVEAVRCVGNHNASKSPVFPRAHHKFVVFGNRRPSDRLEVDTEESAPPWSSLDCEFSFDRVWTGSFNFTHNAGASFENALLVRDDRIARAYLGEFAQIAALSEPLNWDSEWCAPEWRLGS